MNTHAFRRLFSAALMSSVLGISSLTASSGAEAKNAQCRLDVKGNGTRGCQCEVLLNQRASAKVLRRLSDLGVCDGVFIETDASDRVSRQRPPDPPPPPPHDPEPNCDQPQMGDDSHMEKGNNEGHSTRTR